MKKTFSPLGFLGVAACLLSCSEPPPTPDLLGHPVKKAERVLLDDNIDSADIRQIFDALNEDGQLEGLAPWVRDSNDTDLNTLGSIITKYIYQPAQDSTGLVAVLADRVQRRAFTHARNASQEYSRHADNKALSELIEAVVRSPRFVDIVERDIGFLSPSLDASLDDLHQEFQKAWSSLAACPYPGDCASNDPVSPAQSVIDATRLLSKPGLKNRFITLCDSLSNSWPVIGLLESLRDVNKRHGGHAFDGMGNGFAKMVRELTKPASGLPPTQFDSLMDLILAMEGSSDGLFTSIQDKLDKNPDISRELGTLLQPNLPQRLSPYLPYMPNTVTAMLVAAIESKSAPALSPTAWTALTHPGTAADAKGALFEFFEAARTSHENLIGAPRDADADDYLLFNRPLYLNSYALSKWIAGVMVENKAGVPALKSDHFVEKLLALPVTTSVFDLDFTEIDATGESVFAAARLKELSDFGFNEFAAALKNSRPSGEGNFHYTIGAFKAVPLRQAIRQAMEAIDTTRGYADGSAVLRATISDLTRRRVTGKSLLESLETKDLLLGTHRVLASMDVDTWKLVRGVVFDGMSADAWSGDTKKTVLGLFDSKPAVATRVSRVIDSLGVLKTLDSGPAPGTGGISAFEAYLEIVHESGPREWRALSDALLFVADSGAFSMEIGPDGKLKPRFPTALNWLSVGNASGLLRLASELEPSRYRHFADFIHDVIRLHQGIKGSELHWDFFQEILQKSPAGVAAFLESFQGGSLSSARATLSEGERLWITRFVHDGAFRRLWQVVSPHLNKGGPGGWLKALRHFEKDKTLKSVFRLMGLVKNDRIKAIAKMLQEWETSGELAAFLDTLENFVVTKRTQDPTPTQALSSLGALKSSSSLYME